MTLERIKTYFIVPALVISLVSCQSRDDSTAEHDDTSVATQTAFTPKPQHVPEQEIANLQPGDPAPAFNLPDVSGKFYTLDDFADANALVVIFTCNHCPTAQAYEERMIHFTDDYRDKGVAVVAIMPNSTMALLPEECGYTDMNDTYEEMQIRAAHMEYNFPYLYDGDNQAVSLKYGPSTTPHAFVFDKDRNCSTREG